MVPRHLAATDRHLTDVPRDPSRSFNLGAPFVSDRLGWGGLVVRKVIVCAALTGGLHGKQQNPALPEQPQEIAEAAYACWQAGAAIVHLHARDEQGKTTPDVNIFRRTNRLVRERCDVIINDTTGVGPGYTPEERMQVLDAKPEIATMNMGTMVRTRFEPGSLFLNTRQQIEDYAKAMLERGVKPEMEIYNHSMFIEAENIAAKGLVTKPYWFNLVLGMSHMGALQARPKDLVSLLEYLPTGAEWCVTAIGAAQLPLTTMAALLGGHVRVGMEDNIYYRKGELAQSNAQLVQRAVRILQELELEVASPDEARELLGLEPLR